MQRDRLHGEQLAVRHHGTGQETPVLASSAPIRQQDGTVGAVVVTLQDITSLKATEREKEAFLASAAHDLRNPLTALFGMSQVLQMRIQRTEPGTERLILDGLRSIELTAERMNGQITELLDHSRLRGGQAPAYARQPVDLRDVLERIALLYQQTTEGHSIRLQSTLPRVEVIGDAARLERAITNLVSNAIKYSPRGGTITIGLDCQEDPAGRWAHLSVADEGLGIPAAELPHVLERFYRASNARDAVPGTGLGLAGVSEIVRQHGGSLALASEEGLGTIASIRLPAEPEGTTSGAPIGA